MPRFKIKLKALLSRRHYSVPTFGFGHHRYHKLGNEKHTIEVSHHHDHHHHHHLRLLKSLCKLSPLACMRASTPRTTATIRTGGGGTSLGSSRKGYSVTLSNTEVLASGGGGRRIPKDVHKGSCAVYVGPEHKRFVMKTCYLEHPAFGVLLRKSEQEFGFEYDGGLTIPCPVSLFEYVLRLMKEKHPSVEAMTKLLHTIESHSF